MSTTAARSEEKPLVAIILAVFGAFCGTLITQFLASSPTLNLIGAAVGSAIATLISAAGPYPKLRVSMGLLVAVVAWVATYGGVTIVTEAAGKPGAVFPPPPFMPTTSTTTPTTTPTTIPPDELFRVTPATLKCDRSGCDADVTVTNLSSTSMEITTIEIDGPAWKQFTQAGDCDRPLAQNESCSLTVDFKPDPAGTDSEARLVIHHNLQGTPSYVQLRGPTGGQCDVIDANGVGIGVCVGTIQCNPGCGEPLTIRSVGTAELRIDSIVVDGADKSFVPTTDCGGYLRPGDTCTVTVDYTPSGSSDTQHSRLVINQNLRGPPTYVELSGTHEPITTGSSTPPSSCVAGTGSSSTCPTTTTSTSTTPRSGSTTSTPRTPTTSVTPTR